jgi:hypothetical protein
MTLVLTTSSNPGAAAWDNATTLPGTRLPLTYVPLTGTPYTIPDGDNMIYMFETVGGNPENIVVPAVADNIGRTLVILATGFGTITVATSGTDVLAPYGVPFVLDGSNSPRCLTLVAISTAQYPVYGTDSWLVQSAY